MRREEITLDDGLVCLSINGKSETVFNPTDLGFIEKLFLAFDSLEAKQKALEEKIGSAEPREVFRIARDADADMRELVDGVMGAGTCAAQFGDMNVYARAGGLPVWANLLFAVMDLCETESVSQQKQMRPALEKYAAKYAKYQR